MYRKLDQGYEPRRAPPGNENLAERKTREKRKMYSGCAHHCAAGTEFSHSITRDERSERASERLAAGNTVEWNGTERNGRSVTKYQLSPYQRATLYIHAEPGVAEQCATCFSFVLDVRLSSVPSSPSSFELFSPLSLLFPRLIRLLMIHPVLRRDYDTTCSFIDLIAASRSADESGIFMINVHARLLSPFDESGEWYKFRTKRGY